LLNARYAQAEMFVAATQSTEPCTTTGATELGASLG
jgi:hypothetical protein